MRLINWNGFIYAIHSRWTFGENEFDQELISDLFHQFKILFKLASRTYAREN